MQSIDFKGRVAIVTGAGGGMGRSHALALARRGAAVVVNDYGGNIFGGHAGESDHAAKVVAEIRASGGRAIASRDPVGTREVGEKLVALAIEEFGRLDILINNAGIALPGALDALDFDAVENLYRTNLIGPHALIRAAWPVMRAQQYGRIVNISSNAALGIGGNSPYAASKAGLLGLTLDLALEGQGNGIRVNAVMPTAYSRMIENVPDPEVVAWMKESFSAWMVTEAILPLLAEGDVPTGKIWAVGGGRLAQVAFIESAGIFEAQPSAETVAQNLAAAGDMTDATLVEKQGDTMDIYARLVPFARASGPGLASDALTGIPAKEPE